MSTMLLCNVIVDPAEGATHPDHFHVMVQKIRTVLFPFHADKAYSDADLQGSSSDSEDELMGQYQEAVTRSQGLRGGAKAAANHKRTGGFRWDNRQKYSRLTADYDGYSSEASANDGTFCVLKQKRCWLVAGAVALAVLQFTVTRMQT